MDKNDNDKNTEDTEEIENEEKSFEQEIKQLQDQVKRTLADYQNLEKRIAGERREIILSANKQLLQKLLPVLDTLMMASHHVDDQGLKLSINQFLDTLKSENVTRIETEGKSFDPYLMEVVSTQEGEENKVLQEVRAGFMLYDKILRPAQVVVGKKMKD